MEAGIAFSLTLSILIAYYRTEKKETKKWIVGASIILGCIAAIVSAILRSIPHLLNRTSFSFWSMIPVVTALSFILIFIIFEKRLRKRTGKFYEIAYTFSLAVYIISSFFYYLPPVFIQLNNFVYYGESAISTMVLFRVIGYSFGIMMMILSAIALYNTGIKLKSKQLEVVVLITLLLRGLNQVIVIVQRLYSVGIIPKRAWIFKIIATIVNKESYITFIVMVFLVIVPITLWKQNIHIKEHYKNNAELRKIKFRMRNSRHWAQFFLVLIIINLLSLTVVKNYAGREVALSKPEEYQMEEGIIVVPLDMLEDGHLHRYIYHSADGIDIRFFLIKKSQNSYGVVLDACEICGPSGYFERNNDIVCKLCDVVMNRGTIGFKGGCNPIPFPYVVHDQKIKIQTKDLDAMSYVFK